MNLTVWSLTLTLVVQAWFEYRLKRSGVPRIVMEFHSVWKVVNLSQLSKSHEIWQHTCGLSHTNAQRVTLSSAILCKNPRQVPIHSHTRGLQQEVFTGQIPFLSPNQQRHSTERWIIIIKGRQFPILPLKRHIAYTTACCYHTSRDLRTQANTLEHFRGQGRFYVGAGGTCP